MHPRRLQYPEQLHHGGPSKAAPLRAMSTLPVAQPNLNTSATPLHAPSSPPIPQNTHATAILTAKSSRRRNRTAWAQALVLFNVVGIPLSLGMYLEYRFNTTMPTTSLSSLALVIALQYLFILSTPLPIGWLYHRTSLRIYWRPAFLLSSVVAFGAQLALVWVERYGLILVLQGVVLPVALGVLFTLSTLVLSLHYRGNLPLVSMQSGFFGCSGGVVYGLVARQEFQERGRGCSLALGVTAGVLLGTLLLAWVLIRRPEDGDVQRLTNSDMLDMRLPRGFGKILKEDGTIFFVIGYFLIFFAIFVFPTYVTLILTQPPTLYDPKTASCALLAALSTAALSASTVTSTKFRRRIGPVDSFCAACIFAGAVSIIPIWVPKSLCLIVTASSLYGAGMGVVLALQIKVTTVFHAKKVAWQPDIPARVAIMMALGGTNVFAGLLTSAWIFESYENGPKIVVALLGGCLVGGGVMGGVARWKRCQSFYIAI